MTRKDQLIAMRPRDLIALADKLGVKIAASKNRVNLKEKKSNVVERILLAEGGDSDVEPIDDADSTTLEDAESDSTNQTVETMRPEEKTANFAKEINLEEVFADATLTQAEFSSNVKRIVRNGDIVGHIILVDNMVTVAVTEGGFNVGNFNIEEFKSRVPNMI